MVRGRMAEAGGMNKEQIRQFGYELGADAVGVAAIENYDSKRMPPPRTILSDLRSVVFWDIGNSTRLWRVKMPGGSMISRVGAWNLL